MAKYYIGISGWRYPPWRKVFYPDKLAQRLELNYASRLMASIEINGSFYSLQRPTSYEQWRDATPEDFVFSVKCPRYITHMRRLRDIEAPMGNFFASGVLALRQKLGPFLWQFPPNFSFKPEVFEPFLKMLPRTMKEAAELGEQYDGNLKWGPYLEVDKNRKLRHAVEIRNETFVIPRFFEMLRKYNVAFVFADTASKWPYYEEVTSDFIYVRLHGDEELYASGYTPKALKQWGDKFAAWHDGGQPPKAKRVLVDEPPKAEARDVYVYFDNDIKVHAPFDAMNLMKLLKVAPKAVLDRLDAGRPDL